MDKPFVCRVFAQKEADLVRHMEEEKQGVEEEKMKVAKMKNDQCCNVLMFQCYNVLMF